MILLLRKGNIMAETLRYEGLFEVGDHIRAYDFEPRAGTLDRYLEGRVTGVKTEPRMGGAKVYVVDVDRDSDAGPRMSRVGDEGYVPMGLAWFDFDGRVVLSERGEEERLSRTEAADEVEALKAKVARLEAALKRSEAAYDELGRDNYEGDRY